MPSYAIATKEALLIARRAKHWSVEQHLVGKSPECVAVDLNDPRRLYCGTLGNGPWRSEDAGRSWEPAGEALSGTRITAVAIGDSKQAGDGIVYAGTEPSALFRSEDYGETWRELSGLTALPSAGSWSFPPRPETHHVRWIETDPNLPDRVFVAIEAGALVLTLDGGQTWLDRVSSGPLDTHAAATHRMAEGRVYSAAGDGYFESVNGGRRWTRPMDGLRHSYLVGVAVDPADPETVVVSAAFSPGVAYDPRNAEAYVYRKEAGRGFQPAMAGLPDPKGTVASRFATLPDESGIICAANNHGLYRSDDGGQAWKALEIRWPQSAFAHGVGDLTGFPE